MLRLSRFSFRVRNGQRIAAETKKLVRRSPRVLRQIQLRSLNRARTKMRDAFAAKKAHEYLCLRDKGVEML